MQRRVEFPYSVLCNLVAALALAWAVTLASATSAQAQFTVTAMSMQDYTINGAADPPLTLVRGQTYTFQVTTPGHPFFIKTQTGTGTGNQFSNGVTNNGATSGTLTFAIPLDAPAQLFYQCSVHAAMSGTITIAAPVSAQSAAPWHWLVLGLMLAAAAYFRLVKRLS